MDPQRYARVKEVFREAMRWAPEERAAVVAELVGDDAALRGEVMSLLSHHDDAPLIREPARNVVREAGELAAKTATTFASVAAVAVPEEAAPKEDAAAKETTAAPSPEPPGRTLAELLGAERAARAGSAAGWPLERVVRVLEPIVDALAAIADRGDVHGAVRAARITAAETGGELVLALGAAGDAGPRGTDTASRIESAEAASAAPEQISPTLGPTGPWTDVYSLALLCIELMLGRPPVEGSAVAVLARVRDETVQPTPRAVGLEVPAAVEAVMAMALAMRPMQRYQDVRRFWTALRESLVARPPPPAASASASASASLAGRPAKHRWSPKAAMAAAGVLVAALAIALAVMRCG